MGVGAGLYMYVVVVQKFTFAISSPDEFLSVFGRRRDRTVVKFRSARIHRPTGNLVSGSVDRPGNSADAAEIPIVSDTDVALGKGARPTESPEKSSAATPHN